MRRPVDQPLRDLSMHHYGLANNPLPHQIPRFFPTGRKTPLMADHQLRSIFFTRIQHAICLAKANRHRLFANNTRHTAIRRANRTIGMEKMPCANADDIEIFFCHHLLYRSIGIGNAKLLTKLLACNRMGIGNRHHLCIGHAQIPIGVTARN